MEKATDTVRRGRIVCWGFYAWFAAALVAAWYFGSAIAAVVLLVIALAWVSLMVRAIWPDVLPQRGQLVGSRGLLPAMAITLLLSGTGAWWHPPLPGEPVVTVRHCLFGSADRTLRRLNTTYSGGRCGQVHTPLGANPFKPGVLYTVTYGALAGYVISAQPELDLIHLPPGVTTLRGCVADQNEPWTPEDGHFRLATSCGSFTTGDAALAPKPGAHLTLFVRGSELVDLV